MYIINRRDQPIYIDGSYLEPYGKRKVLVVSNKMTRLKDSRIIDIVPDEAIEYLAPSSKTKSSSSNTTKDDLESKK